MKSRIVVAAFAAACLVAPVAYAQEAAPDADAAPGWFSHEGAVELTWDHAEDDVDTVAATVEYALAARLSKRLTVQASVVFEPIDEAAGDSTFEGEGAYLETVTLQYAGDAFTVYGGKFNAVFGSAPDLAPGLYGAEIGESYEITERVGVGGDVNLAALAGWSGEHVLSAALFTADRSALSGSIGTERPELELADGGPGNTEGLESFAVSFDGALDNGFGYSVGYSQLAAGLPGEADQRSLVAGVNYTRAINDKYETDLFAEVASVDGVDGVDGAERTLYTAGQPLRRDVWHAAAIVSGSSDNDVGGGVDLGQLELSLGRDFDAGVTLDAGVKFIDEDGERSTVVGLRLTFGFGG